MSCGEPYPYCFPWWYYQAPPAQWTTTTYPVSTMPYSVAVPGISEMPADVVFAEPELEGKNVGLSAR